MGENDNIPQMTPSFENICRKDENGNEYWSSRDLCGAMGYSAYWKFQRVIDKAIKVAGEKGMNVDEHFNQAVDMKSFWTPRIILSRVLHCPADTAMPWYLPRPFTL